MKTLDLKDSLGAILNLPAPWFIKDVLIQHKTSVVDIFIDFEPNSKFKCSDCEQMCSVYDSNEKRVRHLDLWQYHCYLNMRLPRIQCKTHGIKVLKDLPVSRPGSHYSFFLKS
jgi:transposase